MRISKSEMRSAPEKLLFRPLELSETKEQTQATHQFPGFNPFMI